MAVPKKKTSSGKSRQRRNQRNRRYLKRLANVTYNEQGEPVLRHRMSASGYYKGIRILALPKEEEGEAAAE